MATDGGERGDGARGFRPGRGLTVVAIFVGAFLVLQLAEAVWRRFAAPERSVGAAPAAASAREGASDEQAPFPEIRRDGDMVTVRSGGNRTRVRLEEGDDPQAFLDCVRGGLEQALGRTADTPPGPDVPRQSRREVQEHVHEVTQRCIAEANGIAPPPQPPPPPIIVD